MGVTALRDLAVIEETTLDEYADRTVAVDAHHWLFRYMSVQVRYMDEEYYTTSDGEEVPNLLGMLRGLPTLLNTGMTPVFVFDGAPEELKADEIAQRRESKDVAKEKMEAARENGDVEEARRYKSQSQSLTPTIHETSRELLDLLGVPYAEADGAGEGYAARLVNEHDAFDAALTGDYDSVLFGSQETVRPFSGDDGVERIRLTDTLMDLGLTHEQLVDAAILIGTDYNGGVSGVGPKRAVKHLTDGKDAVEIAGDWDAEMLTGKKIDAIREIFLEPPTGELTRGTSLSDPDFEAAEQFLVDTWEVPRSTVQVDVLPRLKTRESHGTAPLSWDITVRGSRPVLVG